MTKVKSIIFLFAVSMLCIACSSTPQSRIEKNTALYYGLPVEHRQLVEKGRITEGMNTNAVFLAWGKPSSIAEGIIDGKQTTRWIYSYLQPVYTPRPGGYWGPWGPWGPRYGYWGGYHDDITYIPTDAGYVLFVNGLVDSWEKRN